MNKAKLKTYAPQARKDFIAAVTARANQLGLSEQDGKLEVATAEMSGDVVIIVGQPWPAKVQGQREQLIKRIQKNGFAQTMEAVAYTWFNRFAALRYMEIHDYLDHGHRVLSNREGGMPEILNHATELELPGFNKAKAVELKLAGNKDGELYKILLVAQCNALSRAMPFLFERIDDETELLLPDNLLRTDSIIAKLVEAIPEEDWQEVEIIGWLYQFYISEKKDEVIGKVVKSEDIPAATQLFTPNWIVQYLVQNSVGRLWLMANPASTLKSLWPYYIEPAEQTPDVGAALAAITQARMDEDDGSLNPETITVLDPACGSGHILVVAYDVLKAIYLERGYQLRAIPRLILEKNLYGLDIDDRAAQLAGFALLMKARADDRRLFDNPPKLNVLALQESKGLDANEIVKALNTVRAELVEAQAIPQLIETFAHAKTFGSLIQIPQELNAQLPTIAEGLQQAIKNGDLYAKAAAQDLLPLVAQAKVLGMKFDSVVANPPYMGSKGMNEEVKNFAKNNFPDTKSDLFAMFIERGFGWCKLSAFNSMVTMQSWMFLSSFESMRVSILRNRTLTCMTHMGNGVMGIAFGTVASIFAKFHVPKLISTFCNIESSDLNIDSIPIEFPSKEKPSFNLVVDDFLLVPGAPISYWISGQVRKLFSTHHSLGEHCFSEGPCKSGNDAIYMRSFWEVSLQDVGSDKAWCMCAKGGGYQKYYGNLSNVISWREASRRHYRADKIARISPDYVWNSRGVTWTIVTSKPETSFRELPQGAKFNSVSPTIFCKTYSESLYFSVLSLLNSKPAEYILRSLNPTLAMNVENVLSLPYPICPERAIVIGKEILSLTTEDQSESEESFDFQFAPFAYKGRDSLPSSWSDWAEKLASRRKNVCLLEEENNRLFIEAYGLQGEVSPEVPEDQITLARADREKDCQRLISYAIGCMMGRYSLDEPGLIYAHATNVGFDATRYQTFPADADGIVPLTDELWFEDDAANRIREFLLAVWGAETLEKNLAWLAESLGTKGNETPEETSRRYLASSFFKNHLQTYKKRPIYWLFSSGKQGAFQALVYLHRYHEGTLARMRSEYVVPLTSKIQSRIEMLTKDTEAATATAARSKLNKEIEGLRKKHVELLSYDEKLRHYADRRIKLDLDDGVKVNYGKFGDLLAEVKIISGNNED